ncbi:MAG: sensor histidine kinase, partial [Candidatus Limnocylindrales bacterium]
VLDRGTAATLVFETRRPGRISSDERVSGSVAAAGPNAGWRSAVAAPVILDERLWGVLCVVSTSDRPFPLDTEGRVAEFSELVATAIANGESREELNWVAEEQAALRRVATLVARATPPEGLFAVVAEEVARVVHVPLVSIVCYESDGSATERASFSERGELFPVGTRWSLEGTNVVAGVRESGRPARINDYSGLDGAIAQTARRTGIRSTVGVPIVVARRLWGAMVVSSAELEPLPEGTEARLADFTELVATAIENAEIRAELDASRARIVATADATRRRLERDLHDGAQQRLVSLVLELRTAEAMASSEHNDLGPRLSLIGEGLDGVLDDLREFSRGLHPAILSRGGLKPALKVLARRSAVPVELDIPIETRLPEDIEATTYYVVSEALTNAAKYALASVVHVAVEARHQTLRVSVRDEGPGGADPARGSGLVGLKDRVEANGGMMSLQSPPGAGTSLVVELPLDDHPR